MRFRVWEEGIKRKEGDVLLKLTDLRDGTVAVTIVNEEGKWEWDLTGFENGKISIVGGIVYDEYSEGLILDEEGKIEVAGN